MMRWVGAPFFVVAIAAAPAMAADVPGGTVELSMAWTPATAQTGGDSPIYMTIANHGGAPDSLVRARCPTNLADFTEKHATDRGEGGTSMREVKSLPIPPGATVTLAPGGDHLMLLHLREALQEGQTFKCSLVFQAAGTVSVDVKIASSEAKQAP